METELTDIGFDFITYYKSLTMAGQKSAFKYLVCQKTNTKPRTFEKWVAREELPSGSIAIHITEIIDNPEFNLPKYK